MHPQRTGIILHILVAILLLDARVTGVESPLETIKEDLKLIMDSISTAQDSINKLRDEVLAQFEVNLNHKIDEKDEFEKQTAIFSEKIQNLETKIDQLRPNEDKENVLSRLEERIASMERNVVGNADKMSDTKNAVDGVAADKGSLENVIKKLNNIEAKLGRGMHRRRNHRLPHKRQGNSSSDLCQLNSKILKKLEHKMSSMEKTLSKKDSAPEMLPKFDFLRSEHFGDNNVGYEDTEKDKHKISVPLKRINKKLNDILSEVQTKNDQIRGQIADFRLVFSEQSQEQAIVLQNFAKNFASLEQLCGEHGREFARFSSTTSPTLERIDRWTVSWQSLVSQKLSRILDQNSYDHQVSSKENKQLERLLLDAFDKCSAVAGAGVGVGVKETDHVTNHQSSLHQHHNKIFVNESLTNTERDVETKSDSLSDQPIENQEEKDEEELGCEDPDLVDTGHSKVFRVGSADVNEGGRDYNIRYCEQKTAGGGWTVIQRRADFGEPRENFTRDWTDYKNGFGDLNGEFWFGNEFIHQLTKNKGDKGMRLRVELESHYGQSAWAEYDTFRVDGEDQEYRIWVGGYSGNASDSLSAHNGFKFSTVDRNNDQAPKCCPCAPAYGGGWWFYSCFEANLNGEYFPVDGDNGYYRGIIWELWLGDNSLKAATMMIRPETTNVI